MDPRSIFLRSAAVAIALSGAIAATSSSAAADVTVGFSFGPVSGVHAVPSGDQTVAAPVLPFFRVRAGSKVDVFAEAIPPFGPQGFSDDLDTQIQLSNALVRYHVTPRIAVAAGASVLNQKTVYPLEGFSQSSRVVGARYELLARPYLDTRSFVEVRLATDPAIHGLVLTQSPDGSPVDPRAESGSDVDLGAAYGRSFGRSRVEAGVRYFNYQAMFVDTRALADRNRIVYPYLAYDVRIGR